ncbi:MAG: N-formylglutamate deformylase [Arenicellales bacterium]
MVYRQRGEGPILLAQPHSGTRLPDDIAATLNTAGRALADTDWHVDRLYDGLLDDATVVRATFSRYVIDANRDPANRSLYPGMNTTGLCPTIDFDGGPIYREGQEPSDDEIQARRRKFHAPYHEALSGEIDRIRRRHGLVILYDCHSIRSHIPYLFDGILPVFNIGTFEGRSCAPAIEKLAGEICNAAPGYSTVVNGRFKGGWTTRHYGAPLEGVHAIQMELAQRAYMEESPPWNYLPEQADRLRVHLKELLEELRALALSGELSH